MEHYSVCNNSKCRFLLDRRINGESEDGAQLLLKKCPSCGGDWSSTCPTCGSALSVRLVEGLPHIACCERKPLSKARAA